MSKSPFLNSVQTTLRRLHYSLRTEQSYINWIKQFVVFCDKKHPNTLGKADMERFLTYLAVERKVSASTQNQALAALVFMYKHVLDMDPPWVTEVTRAKTTRSIPVVLTPAEVVTLLNQLKDRYVLIGQLLYGTGMRLMELVRLRVKDVDFGYQSLIIRDGKGNKDRVVMLPEKTVEPLRSVIMKRKEVYEEDKVQGYASVHMPDALARKYPHAETEWIWQYVFAAPKLSTDPRSGEVRRHHVYEQSIQRAIRQAAHDARLVKRITPHTLRHSFATHLLESGYDIRTIQELMGHKHVETTMIYTHVLKQGGRGVQSPLDALQL